MGFAFLFLFAACKKDPGFGGNAAVKGTIWIKNYNSTFTYLNAQYVGADEDVYIVADDDIAPLDRTKANYKGQFEFPFLYKGKYKVYVYSKDSSTFPVINKAIVKEIEITENRQIMDLDTIVVLN